MKQDERRAAGEVAELIGLSELAQPGTAGKPVLGGDLGIVKDVKLRLTVVVGEAELSIAELLDLRERQVLPLTAEVDAPVDVLLDGRVVARGRLVAVDEHFGVQITEVARRGAPG